MLKDNKFYKEMLLRRDICRFVLDMRMYVQFDDNKSTEIKNSFEYRNYIRSYGNWDERLDNILSRAQKLGVDPNYLDAYEADYLVAIKKRVKLEQELTPKEQSEITTLDREINAVQCLCPEAKTLSAELLRLYDKANREGLPFEENRLKSSLIKILAGTKCDDKYPEYAYLMENESDWTDDLFQAYFLKPQMTGIEHKKNRDTFFEITIREGDSAMLSRLSRYMTSPDWQRIPLETYQLIFLVEFWKANHKKTEEILNSLSKELPFTAEDYLNNLFADFINHHDEMHHCIKEGAIFHKTSGQTANMTSTEKGQALTNLIIPLTRITTLSLADFCRNLANKIVLLEDHYTIATKVNEFLETCSPAQVAAVMSIEFTEAYIEASDKLEKSRTNLVMTLKQINRRKNEGSHD